MWFVKLIYQPRYDVVFIKENMIISREMRSYSHPENKTKNRTNECIGQDFACFAQITMRKREEDKRSQTITMQLLNNKGSLFSCLDNINITAIVILVRGSARLVRILTILISYAEEIVNCLCS